MQIIQSNRLNFFFFKMECNQNQLNQELAHWGLWVKSSLRHVFVNKVLLSTVMSIHANLCTASDCMSATMEKLSRCDREHMAYRSKIFTICSYRKSCQPDLNHSVAERINKMAACKLVSLLCGFK